MSFSNTTGTVGLLGQKSPPFFTHGRVLKTLSSHLQDAPFYVDETKGKVFIDFGNSLPIDESAQLDAGVLGDLLVAVPKNTNPSLNCSDDLLWLGLINYKSPNWYQNTAGVQVFPSLGTFPSHDMDTINTKPLVVAKVLRNAHKNIKKKQNNASLAGGSVGLSFNTMQCNTP